MTAWLSIVLPLAVGIALAAAIVLLAQRQAAGVREAARVEARRQEEEARRDAEARAHKIVLAAEERSLALEEDQDRRERDLDARESALDARARDAEAAARDLETRGKDVERRIETASRAERDAEEIVRKARAQQQEATATLERIAGLTAEQARDELTRSLEDDARRAAASVIRKIEDEARAEADRRALELVIQATQRVRMADVIQTTVSYIDLPSDEMKGRIIGREGRNIRALENATGIDLIIDDTPQAILISSFDPVRRHVARVAIQRLVEDGRIHPARIEEVVDKVREETETLVEEAGSQAAFELGMSDLHPRLARRIGRMKLHIHHGANLLQHCTEVALLGAHMAAAVGARTDVVRRAGLFHEIARVDPEASGHAALASADLAGRFGESEEVVHAIQALHPEVEPTSAEAILLAVANKIADNRPGARKENLEVFVERLRRVEGIALAQPGVRRAYAVKAGKELRVVADAAEVADGDVDRLCRTIARTLEREVAYPGQIRVTVVRETRAVTFAV